MIHLVFYKTSDVFKAEELLNSLSISNTIVPTPVQDKAYCGVCIRVCKESFDQVEKELYNMEYVLID